MELSHATTVDFVASVSAIDTRFLSPPEIPRTKAANC